MSLPNYYSFNADVSSTTFFHAKPKEEAYAIPPVGFYPDRGDGKLRKALYGVKIAPEAWDPSCEPNVCGASRACTTSQRRTSA